MIAPDFSALVLPAVFEACRGRARRSIALVSSGDDPRIAPFKITFSPSVPLDVSARSVGCEFRSHQYSVFAHENREQRLPVVRVRGQQETGRQM
ncbi:hypothetical protein FHR84_003638 [Actinopolyspora biskrensis]|uniref:Uncharacterized protein n=1 Tax=Actinopolyspora biskrensis TaxID=1470178 RepID=A0A852Z3F2_9ACTN|nr:hypothetical protein [Actinopolyspora biskrensis]NYH80289.1 hypothetical protein [Actinopolyspora biskrensis]